MSFPVEMKRYAVKPGVPRRVYLERPMKNELKIEMVHILAAVDCIFCNERMFFAMVFTSLSLISISELTFYKAIGLPVAKCWNGSGSRWT
jgi:hypothetical protein